MDMTIGWGERPRDIIITDEGTFRRVVELPAHYDPYDDFPLAAFEQIVREELRLEDVAIIEPLHLAIVDRYDD